jgi:hypothetical protein
LQDIIPAGLTLTVVRWNHDELHNRYILTDQGGIHIGEGLDQANPKAARTDDLLMLISPPIASQLLDRYCGAEGKAKQLLRHPIVGRRNMKSR